MITPQRKSFPAVQTPRKIFGTRVLNSAIDSKGKAVAFAGVMKPPQIDSIRDKKSFVRTPVNVGYADDWRRFKEVGLLNEASMEKKERQALLEKVSKLEKELFDYQHNMGLLLIEKRKSTSENEELSQALAEVEEILKREKTANLIALSEAEKREENLRKALIDENQSVAELKFALRRPQEKHCQAKVAYETKLAEANSLIVGVEQKAIEVEKLRHVAEEKLVEVNRKETEVEKKLKEVEIRESLLQLERLSFVTERETHEATVYKLREELSGREKRLTVEERKLSELEQHLNEKDEKIVENEGSLKDKEMSLELAIEENEKSFDEGFLRKQEELKQQEAEINHMKEELSKKEAFLNKKSEEVMEKELELEARWKSVKEKEESFKAEETRLQMEKRKLDDERGRLCELKDEIEGIEAETAQRELRVYEEQEKLKVTKEERSGFIRLQFELKQQMEKYEQQEELLLKEHECLRQERNKFEKERSFLEEKRVGISTEQKETSEGKKKLETQQPSEEKGLKGEVTYPRDYKRKELDHIKLHEEALEATIVNENRMQEENEKDLGIRVTNFELRCLKQLGKKDLSKKLAQIEMETVHSERLSPERQTKEEQTEMHKDIDEQTENVSDLALLKKLPSSTQIYDAVMEAGDGFETSAAHNSHMEVRNVETSNASQYSDRNTYKRRGKPKKSKTQSSLAKNATEEVSIEGNSRKRQHEQTSKRIVIEQDGNEKDCHAHSLTAGGRRKRKQITSQIPPSPVQHHYNLRSRNK